MSSSEAILAAIRRADEPSALAAALAFLELAEPDTLEDALQLAVGKCEGGAFEGAIRRAWTIYHHDRGRGWN